MTSIAPTRRILATGAARTCLRANGPSSSHAMPRATFSSNSIVAAATTTTPRAGPRQHQQSRCGQPPIPRTYKFPSRHGSVRWSSISATGSKIWTFKEIQSLTTNPQPTTTKHPLLLIDVREPHELAETGRIPGALNVPITTSPDSFHLSDSEFAARHGFALPSSSPKADTELVLYCKAGVRARAAARLAREAGWARVGEYPGSWLEWAARGGEVEK